MVDPLDDALVDGFWLVRLALSLCFLLLSHDLLEGRTSHVIIDLEALLRLLYVEDCVQVVLCTYDSALLLLHVEFPAGNVVDDCDEALLQLLFFNLVALLNLLGVVNLNSHQGW